MLSLSGPVLSATGFSDGGVPVVLRTMTDDSSIQDNGHDALLVRGQEGLERLSRSRARRIVYVGPSTAEVQTLLSNREATLSLDARFDYLAHGDIIGLRPSAKRIRSLYRKNSRHNSFLVTERCNHYCLMCSQPPRNIDDSWLLDEIAIAISLVDKSTHEIGFTGGEPLLEWARFIDLLALSKVQLPDTEVHVLSNGRAFADANVTRAWAAVDHKRLMVGIPIYASVDTVHNYVVQADGAFEETVLGILRLKNAGQRVEVRVVLHAVTAPHIVETCRWLARNLPFVDHVALMGLENTGFALANQEELWIDPIDYKTELAIAADILASAGVRTSIYNVPLCLLEQSARSYSVQSISDWKNAYQPECSTCVERQNCGGFFTTGKPRFSRAIRPFS